jgi:apolipoprotein N-acyltransferase
MTQTLVRAAAWITLAAIVVVTLGPIGLRPMTDAPVQVERAVAFFLAGLLFAVAYPRHIWWAVALLVVATFGLEWLQNLRPDRHGREADAAVKFVGAALGIAGGWLLANAITARRSARR